MNAVLHFHENITICVAYDPIFVGTDFQTRPTAFKHQNSTRSTFTQA